MPSPFNSCISPPQVLGLTTAVGVIRGTSSAEFAVALIFSMVVMYDASGVRLHAGKTASVLNMIITELPPDHPVSDTRPLRDTLGHTPLQASEAPFTMSPDILYPPCAFKFFGSVWSAAGAASALGCTLQVAAGAVLGLLVGYVVGVSWTL